MQQKSDKKRSGAIDLQPTIPKFDRLLEITIDPLAENIAIDTHQLQRETGNSRSSGQLLHFIFNDFIGNISISSFIFPRFSFARQHNHIFRQFQWGNTESSFFNI
jgi:hypothetical protein